MDIQSTVIVFITLALAAVFLFIWKRRDAGVLPQDRLPEVLDEPLDGHSPAR